MKILFERTEICSTINYKEYPTVVIDVAKRDGYGIRGANVCIDAGTFRDGKPHYIKAKLRTFHDDNKLVFQSSGVYLAADFSFRDMMEILEYANAPIIKPNQDILVCMYNSIKREAYNPVLLRTGKKVDSNCITPLGLEELEVVY